MNMENFKGNYIYRMYDKVAEKWGPTFEAVNDAVAVRSVRQMKIQDFSDFELVCVGASLEDGKIKELIEHSVYIGGKDEIRAN